jgi:hypothetical protein
MKTNSSSQRKHQSEAERLTAWRKILRMLRKCCELAIDVQKVTGRKYDMREWIQ